MTRRLVVEADGGSRGNPGPAGYGAVVREATSGAVLAEVAEGIGRATNNVAEYRGLIAGLRAAAEVGLDADVEVRMDSKLVVEQCSGRWKINKAELRALADEARELARGFRSVRWTWIPRAQNAHADRLANQAMDGRPVRSGPPAAAADVDDGLTSAPLADPASVAAAEEATRRPPNRLVGWAPELSAPTTVVLLRHGETPFTVEKRFSGRGVDPELTEHGRWQAERAAAHLAARGTVEAVVCSPLRRTRQTAEVVARALRLPVRVEEGFAETEFGEWDGATFAEVQQRDPEHLAAWLADPTVAPPGGESFVETARRVAVARDKTIARYPGRTVLVVTHVTPIKTLVRLALDAPDHALFRMELAAASFTALQYWSDGNSSLRLFNDTAHLHG